jgi:hypothetical protein
MVRIDSRTAAAGPAAVMADRPRGAAVKEAEMRIRTALDRTGLSRFYRLGPDVSEGKSRLQALAGRLVAYGSGHA